MKKAFTPLDIARETLRLLATRHLPPTPDNYRRVYTEIAGFPAEDRDEDAERMLHTLAAELRRLPGNAAHCANLIDQAVENRNWNECKSALIALVGENPAASAAPWALDSPTGRLFESLLKCVRELMADDPSLAGPLERLIARPSDNEVTEEVERSLKAFMSKAGPLKRVIDVQDTLKYVVSRFLAAYAGRIRRTEDPVELNRLLNEVIGETRTEQMEAQSSGGKPGAARSETDAAAARIRQLESELAQAREKVREDRLTGVLNRRGLEDAFAREVARSDRRGCPLCLALLDIDDFKQINNAHGHQAGDGALKHLARIIKDAVRPDDVVTRYGGEEFLVLLADAGLDEALDVILRLQRALTRRPFPHHDDQLALTFSSGVAQRAAGETKEALIERADKALYRAKQAGKNRVFAASS